MKNNIIMEKLKLIANWCYNNQPDNTRNYEDIPVNERDNNPWWYLHGKLESLVHYDKGTVTNCQSGGFGKESINYSCVIGDEVKEIFEDSLLINRMCFDGIVDVEIVRRKTRSRRSAVRELIKNGLIVPLDDPCTKARICCWDQIKY